MRSHHSFSRASDADGQVYGLLCAYSCSQDQQLRVAMLTLPAGGGGSLTACLATSTSSGGEVILTMNSENVRISRYYWICSQNCDHGTFYPMFTIYVFFYLLFRHSLCKTQTFSGHATSPTSMFFTSDNTTTPECVYLMTAAAETVLRWRVTISDDAAVEQHDGRICISARVLFIDMVISSVPKHVL